LDYSLKKIFIWQCRSSQLDTQCPKLPQALNKDARNKMPKIKIFEVTVVLELMKWHSFIINTQSQTQRASN